MTTTSPPPHSEATPLPGRTAVVVFVAFAFAYFLSSLIRAVTATLASELTREFGLQARDLGLLAGGYFLGFAAMQLPLGTWLDRHGPKKVELAFLSFAVLGCLVFAAAQGLGLLLLARVLAGVGLCACLMAPLTGYRRWLEPAVQLRANAWMLMAGSLGMLASTLPVTWLMSLVGWRGVFVGLAALVALSMLVMLKAVPAWQPKQVLRQVNPGDSAIENIANKTSASPAPLAATPSASGLLAGYGQVWRHPAFIRLMPIGFFNYAGMAAIQTLWAGPWMVNVAGYSAAQSSQGLFWLNFAMLLTFWAWGWLTPRLARRGITTHRLIAAGQPISLLVLALIVAQPLLPASPLALPASAQWALFCVTSTFITLGQPAVALAFPSHLAGRALSAYNLVVFAGIFVIQWGIGLMIDAFGALGWSVQASYRGAFAVFGLSCLLAWLWFMLYRPHNSQT